jgi:hypothetical protein
MGRFLKKAEYFLICLFRTFFGCLKISHHWFFGYVAFGNVPLKNHRGSMSCKRGSLRSFEGRGFQGCFRQYKKGKRKNRKEKTGKKRNSTFTYSLSIHTLPHNSHNFIHSKTEKKVSK